MALQYTSTGANGVLNYWATTITTCRIYTAGGSGGGGTLLMQFTTSDSVTGNNWQITSGSAVTATATGTPAVAELRDASNVLLVGDVGTGGTEFVQLGPVTSGQSYSPTINISQLGVAS